MTRNLIIVAAAVVVFAAAFALKGAREDGPAEAGPAAANPGNVPLPKLVDLGADKCVPCKKMAPILEELRNEYRGSLVVEFIDVWKDPEAGKPFEIRMIPTQIFLDASGKERFRHEGFLGKEAILEKWKELGVNLQPRVDGVGS